MDLNRLTPAPWFARECEDCPGDTGVYWTEHTTRIARCGNSVTAFGSEDSGTNAAFIALARNWLDVQERRKWHVWHEQGFGWWMEDDHDKTPRFETRRFASVIEAWQAAVDYDAELRAKEANVENTK